MSKKLKLAMEYTPEFSLIGVFTPQKDYRLCWLLNRHLKTDLRRLPDFIYHHAKSTSGEGKEDTFSVYHYESTALRTSYFMISNRGRQGVVLFPKPKNMDYLLLCRRASSVSDIQDMVKKIREVPDVQAAYLLEDNPDRQAKEVLYDFEMYLNEALR